MHLHICNFTTVANIQRGKVRFDFSDMFGPLFIRKNGEPLKNQPQPGRVLPGKRSRLGIKSTEPVWARK